MMQVCVLLFLFFSSAVIATSGDSGISGCGGFIKVADELNMQGKGKLDYSKIAVTLVTSEGGAVKESTECAPTGYYFIPVYDKGDYKIKIQGSQGWSFEPEEVAIRISEDNKCIHKYSSPGHNKDEDINFSLTGFSITGKVIGENCPTAENNEEPSGVQVTLTKTTDDAFKRTTTTDSFGAYVFTNVPPGEYKLKASHNNWTISKDTNTVTVSWGNVAVSDHFVVSGYDLSGQVASRDEPVLGVDFLLYSDSITSVPCSTPLEKGRLPENRPPPLCIAKSEENGKFSFKNIPCGTYKLVPYYRGANTTFDVVPSEVSITVSRGSSFVKQPFQVMGFSLTGKVINNQGKGIKDAVIRVDGKEKGITDASGYYRLEQLVSGVYDIEASKEHMIFNSLIKYRLSPNVVSLPDIIVKSYHLCGRVHNTQSSLNKRSMILLNDNDAEVSRQTTDQSGNFCFDVAPGVYKVSPVLTSVEESAGLLLNPRFHRVSIINAPLLDLSFNQARVTVSGHVRCIESPCDPSISISLYSENNQNRVTTGLGVREGNAGDYFVFRDVFPGVHRITIHKDAWCWEQESFEVQVKTEDVTSIEFIQSGYLLTVKSSHDGVLVVDSESTEAMNASITNGSNKICLHRAGIHTLKPRSCFKFDQDSYKYDTANPKIIDLSATHYLVRSSVVGVDQKTADLSVSVRKSRKDDQSEKIEELPLSPNPQGFEFSYWAKLGDTIEFIPKSSKLLFYPASRVLTITKSECPPVMEPFEAHQGLFLNGTIDPPLAGVTVSVFLKDTNEKIKDVLTTSGLYEIGPLFHDKQYTTTAEKEGFNFQPTSTGFKAIKLCSILVAVKDAESKSISGVLLSLSGNNYRNNNVTQQGLYTFVNLVPGEYYLRPLLKEYLFEPASQVISLADGEDKSVSFTAKRTAFSCYGTVKSLNGEPEKLVTVEAVGPKGEYEETQSDSNGQFRLRGLLPNTQYKLRIKQGENDRIERASPVVLQVTANNQDIQDVEFVVFRRPSKHDLTGVVVTEDKWLDTLKVVVYSNEDLTAPVRSMQLGSSPFFEFSSLAKGTYILKTESSLPPQKYSYHTAETRVSLEGFDNHVRLSFTVEDGSLTHEVTSAPVFGVLFALSIFGVVFYYQSLIEFIQNVRTGNIWKRKAYTEDNSPSDWLPQSIKNANSSKRTPPMPPKKK